MKNCHAKTNLILKNDNINYLVKKAIERYGSRKRETSTRISQLRSWMLHINSI